MDNKLYTTVDRVKFFIKFKKISLRKFAEIIGVSHSLINNTKSLGSDKLERIIQSYPEVNPIWLLTGSGEMLLEEHPTNTSDMGELKTHCTALINEVLLLKEMNQVLVMSLVDKDLIIKLLEGENERLRAGRN